MSYSLNSLNSEVQGILEGLGLRVKGLPSQLLKGGYIGDYIGEYHRGY